MKKFHFLFIFTVLFAAAFSKSAIAMEKKEKVEKEKPRYLNEDFWPFYWSAELGKKWEKAEKEREEKRKQREKKRVQRRENLKQYGAVLLADIDSWDSSDFDDEYSESDEEWEANKS